MCEILLHALPKCVHGFGKIRWQVIGKFVGIVRKHCQWQIPERTCRSSLSSALWKCPDLSQPFPGRTCITVGGAVEGSVLAEVEQARNSKWHRVSDELRFPLPTSLHVLQFGRKAIFLVGVR